MPSRGQFFTTFEHQAPWGFEIFWFPTRLKILYCNPQLKKVRYKLLFALILKLYGTICHTVFKNLSSEIKKSRNPMGPGGWKCHQTDREGISYHYHSKLGEVTVIPWRRVFKKKNPGSTLFKGSILNLATFTHHRHSIDQQSSYTGTFLLGI